MDVIDYKITKGTWAMLSANDLNKKTLSALMQRTKKVLACLTITAVMVQPAIAGNIIVNTQEDQFDALNPGDNECSLREAVKVTNDIYSITDEERRKAALKIGFGGCKGEDLSPVIELESPASNELGQAATPYVFQLDAKYGEIRITNKVSIQSAEAGFTSQKPFNEIPTIIAAPGSRIFNIDKNLATDVGFETKIVGVNLRGCAVDDAGKLGASVCAKQGGIIRNTSLLSLEDVKLYGGLADLGGAIYNDVKPLASEANSGGVLRLKFVEISNNQAKEFGAALYSAYANYTIARSLVIGNIGGGFANKDAILYTNRSIQSSSTLVKEAKFSITNSTITNNTNAYAVNLIAGGVLNNVTSVNNSRGVYMESVTSTAKLANSILLDIENACERSSSDLSRANNNAFYTGTGCDAITLSTGAIGESIDPTIPLIADADGNGICDSANEPGLLCPLFSDPTVPVRYYRPRLPMSYSNLSESPIVNKGQGKVLSGNNNDRQECETEDLRDIFVDRNECDVGAIELRIDNDANAQTNEANILYNEIARVDMQGVLGDGQLVPAEYCQFYLSPTPTTTIAATDNEGNEVSDWVDGCVRTVQGPRNGFYYIDPATNELVYVPAFNYHGFTKIKFYVITTTSRFSDANNDRSVLVESKIKMEPDTVAVGSTLPLVPGALSLYGLFGLLVLSLVRAKIKKGGC